MLRALGNQIQKTSNKEAMRDLSGRRMRDINEEKRLKDYVAKEAGREREKQEKKEAKLKKLHKLVTPGESKHEFHDPKLKPTVSGVTNKRKAEEKKEEASAPVKRNKPDKGLWIGADLNESDFTDSSDDE